MVQLHGSMDVVIPARDEAATLPATLSALWLEGNGPHLHVIVVFNGERQTEGRNTAEKFASLFRESGSRMTILSSDMTSKPAALNRGDMARTGNNPVMYLDADCVLLPETIVSIFSELQVDEPLLVGPPIRLLHSNSQIARGYFRLWERLPSVAGKVIGAGCFAVNTTGRGRWERFPENFADDAYVRGLFKPQERRLVTGGRWFAAPEGGALSRTIRRWKNGNTQLSIAKRDITSSRSSTLRWLLTTPSCWRFLPAFLLVKAASKLETGAGWPSWRPIRTVTTAGFYRRPKIGVIIVTHNSEEEIIECLESLKSGWADLKVVVVDNASTDGTRERLHASLKPDEVIENDQNCGFAHSVNLAAERATDVDFLLLVNPDTVAYRSAIDALLAVYLSRPDAGIYGGQMLDREGIVDPTSCLSLPGVWSSAVFATCLTVLPGLRFLDPDFLGGWKRDDTREVQILTAGFLLLNRPLWLQLGGFHERFFLYGEDVDLCIRARRLGARAMFSAECVYCHKRGSSHSSTADMAVAIMRGKATLHLLHSSPVAGWIGRTFLVIGTGMRSALENLRAKDKRKWQEVWRRRREWQNGWPAKDC